MSSHFNTCQIMGGLGNQLFQIFNLIAYSKKHKKIFFFSDYKGGKSLDNLTDFPSYFNTFLKPIKKYINKNMKINEKYMEKDFTYNEIPNYTKKNVMLFGYYQSHKYFKDHYNYIYNLLKINKKQQKFKNKYNFNKTISIHLRRGDYKVSPIHLILEQKYYENALNYAQNQLKDFDDYTIYFCYQDFDLKEINLIINDLSLKFKNTFKRVDNNLKDYEQLLFMSCCENNIIANSTFSWWGAYFNKNKNKLVLCPDKYFKDDKLDIKDFYPDEWIKISIH